MYLFSGSPMFIISDTEQHDKVLHQCNEHKHSTGDQPHLLKEYVKAKKIYANSTCEEYLNAFQFQGIRRIVSDRVEHRH
jgi:hypothetical protein